MGDLRRKCWKSSECNGVVNGECFLRLFANYALVKQERMRQKNLFTTFMLVNRRSIKNSWFGGFYNFKLEG